MQLPPNTADTSPEGSGLFGRLLKVPGVRTVAPLLLATAINAQVGTALARTNTQSTDVQANQLLDTQTITTEIADYFTEHRESILKNISQFTSNAAQRNRLEKAVSLIAENKNGAHFLVQLTRLGKSISAKFNGGSKTIFLSDDFNVQNSADQGRLIHEVVHVLQDNEMQKKMAAGKLSPDSYNAFWNQPAPFAVLAHEQSSMEAELEYVNAQTNGALKNLTKKYTDFQELTRELQKVLTEHGITDATYQNKIITQANYYFGDRALWSGYVRYIYGCNLKSDLFTPQLQEIGVMKNETCDDLKNTLEGR